MELYDRAVTHDIPELRIPSGIVVALVEGPWGEGEDKRWDVEFFWPKGYVDPLGRDLETVKEKDLDLVEKFNRPAPASPF